MVKSVFASTQPKKRGRPAKPSVGKAAAKEAASRYRQEQERLRQEQQLRLTAINARVLAIRNEILQALGAHSTPARNATSTELCKDRFDEVSALSVEVFPSCSSPLCFLTTLIPLATD